MRGGFLLLRVVRRAPRMARPGAVGPGRLKGAPADSGGEGAAGGGASGGGGWSQPGRARRLGILISLVGYFHRPTPQGMGGASRRGPPVASSAPPHSARALSP